MDQPFEDYMKEF
jgi:hypothetical protein